MPGASTSSPAARTVRNPSASLALDPENSQAYRTLGRLRYNYEWDWIGAEAALRRAVDLNPSSVGAHASLGFFLVLTGKFGEGVDHYETAQRLDPVSLETNVGLGAAYAWASRWDDTIAQMEFVYELDPNWIEVHHCLAGAYAAKGMWDEAVASCDRWEGAKEIDYCGPIYALAGQRDKALARLGLCTTESGVNPTCAAGIYAGLGEIDEAMSWVETALEQRRLRLIQWMRMPVLIDNLRSDPRFQEIERRMAFPEN